MLSDSGEELVAGWGDEPRAAQTVVLSGLLSSPKGPGRRWSPGHVSPSCLSLRGPHWHQQLPAKGWSSRCRTPWLPTAAKPSPALLHRLTALNGKATTGCAGKLRQGAANGAEDTGPGAHASHRNGSSLTHGAGTGAVRVVQVSPEHRPCNELETQGQLGNAGSIPPFWGGTEEEGRDKMSGVAFPESKSWAKRAAFLVIRLGNTIQADPFPLGRSQAAPELAPKEAAWKTLRGFYSKPSFGGHGEGAPVARRETLSPL